MSTKTSYFTPNKFPSYDYTFCSCDCVNAKCMRHVCEYDFGGHPRVSMANFSDTCTDYILPIYEE
jgi:hypothetical protein